MISRATVIASLAMVPTLLAAQATTTPPPASSPPSTPATPAAGPQVYYDFQVDKPVALAKNKAPTYPKELRSSNISGEVILKFTVDSTGRAVMPSIVVVKADNDAFTKAVRDIMPDLRFTAAVLKGKKVAQLVQMPFQFSMAAPRDTTPRSY